MGPFAVSPICYVFPKQINICNIFRKLVTIHQILGIQII